MKKPWAYQLSFHSVHSSAMHLQLLISKWDIYFFRIFPSYRPTIPPQRTKVGQWASSLTVSRNRRCFYFAVDSDPGSSFVCKTPYTTRNYTTRARTHETSLFSCIKRIIFGWKKTVKSVFSTKFLEFWASKNNCKTYLRFLINW